MGELAADAEVIPKMKPRTLPGGRASIDISIKERVVRMQQTPMKFAQSDRFHFLWPQFLKSPTGVVVSTRWLALVLHSVLPGWSSWAQHRPQRPLIRLWHEHLLLRVLLSVAHFQWITTSCILRTLIGIRSTANCTSGKSPGTSLKRPYRPRVFWSRHIPTTDQVTYIWAVPYTMPLCWSTIHTQPHPTS